MVQQCTLRYMRVNEHGTLGGLMYTRANEHGTLAGLMYRRVNKHGTLLHIEIHEG